MSEKHTCDKNMNRSMWSRVHRPCGRTANSQHEGKWYCGIHDPVKRAERSEIRDARMRARWETENRQRDHQHRLTAARDAVVEAAERWVDAKPKAENARGLTGIWEAVANLRAIEQETSNG